MALVLEYTTMKRYFILILAILLATPFEAQTKKKIHKPAAPANISADMIDTLIYHYRFSEASHAAHNLLSQEQKKSQPTDEAKDLVTRSQLGSNMLAATAKVIVVDSFVTDKKKMLDKIKMDPSCGELAFWGNLFQKGKEGDEILETTTYVNDFKDKRLFSSTDAEGRMRIKSSFCMNDKWSAPQQLAGIGDSTSEEAYPYLLSDGVTLYFASRSDEGLGGYDIYVTRFNSDDKTYLKAENMGMPFSSPYNDYLMVIDEVNNLGWFVSDRFQPQGKVCIYLFIPFETRESYDTNDFDSIRPMAMLHSIKSTQYDKNAVQAARSRFQQMLANTSEKKTKTSGFNFVVYNGIVYFALDQFKSSKARQLASNWEELTAKRNNALKQLQTMRALLTNNASLKNNVNQLENTISQLDDTIMDLEWNIRFEEQSKLGIDK